MLLEDLGRSELCCATAHWTSITTSARMRALFSATYSDAKGQWINRTWISHCTIRISLEPPISNALIIAGMDDGNVFNLKVLSFSSVVSLYGMSVATAPAVLEFDISPDEELDEDDPQAESRKQKAESRQQEAGSRKQITESAQLKVYALFSEPDFSFFLNRLSAFGL